MGRTKRNSQRDTQRETASSDDMLQTPTPTTGQRWFLATASFLFAGWLISLASIALLK